MTSRLAVPLIRSFPALPDIVTRFPRHVTDWLVPACPLAALKATKTARAEIGAIRLLMEAPFARRGREPFPEASRNAIRPLMIVGTTGN
jgi:hypothetical protein